MVEIPLVGPSQLLLPRCLLCIDLLLKAVGNLNKIELLLLSGQIEELLFGHFHPECLLEKVKTLVAEVLAN